LEDFSFHEAQIPEGYQFSITESLFNREAHRKLQAKSNWHSFYLLNQARRTVDGTIHFHLHDGVARSPFKATFGGFDLSEKIRPEIIRGFLMYVEERLKEKGATSLFIKLPLRFVSTYKFDGVEDILDGRGFKVALEEAGSILEVSESLTNVIHHSEKAVLKKAQDRKFKFENIPLSELNDIYLFIKQCHDEKGYPLSMSLQEIQSLGAQFPLDIHLFGVKDDDRLVAASICIRVGEKVLYDFYHNHDAFYQEFSPIVFLINGIHDYCYEHQIPFFDLGTAMLGTEVNTSLLTFKLKLGGKRGVKYTFEKRL